MAAGVGLRLARLRVPRLLAVLCLLLLAVPAPQTVRGEDQEESGKLEALERSAAENRARAEGLAKKAEALQNQILALRSEMIAAARRAQDFEENLSTIEHTLGGLEQQELDMTAALQNRRTQLTSTLGALQRIALQPPEAVFAAPGSPIDRVRSAMLLRVAVPAIELQANDLRERLVQLVSLREEIGRERSELNSAASSLEDERAFLGQLIARKNDLYEAARSESESAQIDAEQAAREAGDLRDLLARLEEESQRRAAEAAEQARLAAEARQREAEEAERLALEAERLQRAAEAEAAASAAREDSLAAAEEAETLQAPEALEDTAAEGTTPESTAPQVAALDSGPAPELNPDLTKPVNVRPLPNGPETAPLMMPARGRIATVYGQRDRTGSVSKGLSIETRTAAQVVAPYDGRIAYAGVFRRYGQILIIEHGGRYHTLLAGVDRIDAVVGQWVLAGEPIGVMPDQSETAPELYLELRRTGQPINPLPWLAKTNDKVQG